MALRAWVLTASILAIAGPASAASRQVLYGPPPAWVIAAPKPTDTPSPDGVAARLIYGETQTRLGPNGDEMYAAYRIKLLTPEALVAGNITAAWNPGSDDFTVHALKIIRGAKVIDVLATTKFQVIQRENNLDYAVLDGQLTATLQAPGLQVGDELMFAATIRRKDPTLGDRSNGVLQLSPTGGTGAFRVRLLWPDSKPLQWRPTPDLPAMSVAKRDGWSELTYELRDPKSSILTDGAPARMNLRRMVEYSDFASWAELSGKLYPLFDAASKLAPDSPVRLEAEKIAKATQDPTARAEAALRLVQDRIRYVYVGLDGGNYRPAGADQTWTRRFGDCKAKTVLLLALLRELGVPAEAALVNTAGGDGTDERLPTPAVFDHVVVRATIGGKVQWLDGTRLGDRNLAAAPPPAFRWALPLRPGAVALEAVPTRAFEIPQYVDVVDIDARSGFDAPAKVKMQLILRGDAAFGMRTRLATQSTEDAERELKAYWRQQMNALEARTVTWRYDEREAMLVLGMEGEAEPEWDGDDKDGRTLNIPGAGFTPPDKLRRPKEQDQTAPWVTDFPTFRCWATTLRLPADTDRWRWAYRAGPVDEAFGGEAYWRAVDMREGVIRTVMSRRIYLPEISPAQAQALNARLPKFDNNISYVYQRDAKTTFAARTPATPPPATDATDWTSPTAPCSAPHPPVEAVKGDAAPVAAAKP
jgi:transglutaminase-like putative cysteine protease